MTELAKEAIKKYKGKDCMECGLPATVICCWKNINPTELNRKELELWKEGNYPNKYYPFCDECSSELFEKVNQDYWINHRLSG